MPKVLPSVAVAAIDRAFAFIADPRANPNLGRAQVGGLAGALALIDEIPADLLNALGNDNASLLQEKAAIAAFIEESRT